MNFASDNIVGASRPVLDALIAANGGAEPAYGADGPTRAVERRLAEIFERDCAVFLVATGTGANALALSALVPPYGCAVCHREAHVIDDECGAPEFFTGGAKLAGLPGVGAKLAPRTLAEWLASLSPSVKQMPPRALSISQATECGLVYTPGEVAALAEIAHGAGLKVHMDGARFANALVSLGVSPAEITWKAGVDVLTFGATKNGCLAAEALIVFDPALAEAMPWLRKRSGHTLSKGRLLGAQLQGYLANDHWLDNARHANAMAARLAEGVTALPGARLAFERQANELLPVLPRETAERLRAAGAMFHPWSEASLPEGERVAPHETLVRLVTSFATTEGEIDAFLAAARG
ncbi:low specificity L-threonine aldolase [Salinarimonas sp.]|uniref:threonine aldolase family protein n=1 Tax=Salinarimonas sp. TaxID=2766526 RepID=UPI0032D8D625